MSQTTNVLITGANRGIGKVLLQTYLNRPNHTVIAAVRDPANPTSQSLTSLPKAEGSSLIFIKIDSTVDTDAATAIKSLTASHQITKLDIVIANAGLCDWYGNTIDLPADQLAKTYQVNTIAPFLLFQAALPLLKNSPNAKFIFISSIVGSITDALRPLPFNSPQYGASKAALNFLARKLHDEVKDVVVFPIHPGWLNTEMGLESAKLAGLEDKLTSVEVGVEGIVEQIDGATRENVGGQFVVFDGRRSAW